MVKEEGCVGDVDTSQLLPFDPCVLCVCVWCCGLCLRCICSVLLVFCIQTVWLVWLCMIVWGVGGRPSQIV